MIKISKKWFIDADKHGYALCKMVKVKNKKTGEEEIKPKNVSYHSNVSSALNSYVRLKHKKLVAEEELSIKEAIDKFKEIESSVFSTDRGTTI